MKPSVLVYETSSPSPAKFKTKLLKMAEKSKHHRYRHAALVAKGKQVFGVGVNTAKEHAEVRALRWRIGRSYAGATLYTLMIRKDGSIGKGVPCRECFAYAKRHGIRRIIVYL
jgi:pyrimidine deaminase RibD-like protein